MQLDDLREGDRVMTVCNACRYCEQFCPVFPAMETRVTFRQSDLMYLANLCHNCGECLYACQYAPPHEFAIDLPRTLARVRVRSYEEYCWPRPLGIVFRRQGLWASLGLAAAMIAFMFVATILAGANPWTQPSPGGDFYRVLPHDVMVGLFGGVSLFVLAALLIGARRFWRDTAGWGAPQSRSLSAALRDVLTLRHLHPDGVDCPSAEEDRRPWRRWLHHCTFYGFLLCFASTSTAALYHSVFGWPAPYPYTSLPVLLGVLGGVGLLVGPIGLLLLRRRRDPALSDPAQGGMDVAFITLLVLTSLTGLLLLVLRERATMGPLLIVHLGVVLAFFITLPYGKFVHGIYRAAALLRYAAHSATVEEYVVTDGTGETSGKLREATTGPPCPEVEAEQPLIKVP